MTAENRGEERDFGTEIRAAIADGRERETLLTEMIMEAAGIDVTAARKVFSAFDDAKLVVVTSEGWNKGVNDSASLQRLGYIANELFPGKDASPRT